MGFTLLCTRNIWSERHMASDGASQRYILGPTHTQVHFRSFPIELLQSIRNTSKSFDPKLYFSRLSGTKDLLYEKWQCSTGSCLRKQGWPQLEDFIGSGWQPWIHSYLSTYIHFFSNIYSINLRFVSDYFCSVVCRCYCIFLSFVGWAKTKFDDLIFRQHYAIILRDVITSLFKESAPWVTIPEPSNISWINDQIPPARVNVFTFIRSEIGIRGDFSCKNFKDVIFMHTFF